jgi:enamine deaminase RidA (YjgF/YER057c/UK114 family)
MSVREKIEQLGLTLPPPPTPVGSYLPVIRSGSLLYTSGQLPIVDGRLIIQGKVPDDLNLRQAQASAAQACLNALAALDLELGSLDEIRQVVRMTVYVNSSAGFHDQAGVANGASELLVQIFGNVGRHSRAAVGVAELPLNAPVELDLVVEG